MIPLAAALVCLALCVGIVFAAALMLWIGG